MEDKTDTATMPAPDGALATRPVAEETGRSVTRVEQVRCSSCGHQMAADQRYCLECGTRRGGPRVDFDGYLGERGEAEKPGLNGVVPPPPTVPPAYSFGSAEPDPRPVREVTPLMAAAGLMAFALILIFGVLIGKQGGNGGSQQPIIATTAAPATTPTETSTSTDVNVAFQADWPAGKEGFTIELATLSKDGTDSQMVESTKTELATQGAPEVGVLDSDEFGTLPAGNYVFYSGEYSSKSEAQAAMSSLSAFPDAQVIEVADDASTPAADTGGDSDAQGNQDSGGPAPVEASKESLQALEDASAEEYQEQLKKLPPTIETEGTPPPKDNKPAGGGSGDAVEIG